MCCCCICDLQEMMQIFAASCCRSPWTRYVLCQRPLFLMREQFHPCGWKLSREPPSFWGSPVVVINCERALYVLCVMNCLGWLAITRYFQWHTWERQHQRQHSSSRSAPGPGHPPGTCCPEGNSEVKNTNWILFIPVFSPPFFTWFLWHFTRPVSCCLLFCCCCAFGKVAPGRWTTNAPRKEPAPLCCPSCSAFRTYTAARRSPLLKRKLRWLSFTE